MENMFNSIQFKTLFKDGGPCPW